ncbi:hypothetical protein HDU99_003540, partial [Rhizoclosmatium hyalinum]
MEEELLLERPSIKKKTKKLKPQKQPVAIADAIPEPEPVAASTTTTTTTQLQQQQQQQQIYSFDALLEPSAPPADHVHSIGYPTLESTRLAHPADVLYPATDLNMHELGYTRFDSLMDEEEDAVLVETPPTLNQAEVAFPSTLASPSAPPMELHEKLFTVTTPIPLEDEILGNIYVNTELQELHSKVINDFRKNAKYILVRDEFFEAVLEYERSFSTFQVSSAKVKSLTASIDSLAPKIWILKKSSQKFSSRCLDGVNLVHVVTSEKAALNEDDFDQLKTTLTVTLANYLYEKKKASFQMKMLKLWIQTYIDEHLNDMNNLKNLRDSDIEKLKYFIDVLFFFERRKDVSEIERNSIDDTSAPILPPILMDSTIFMRDIRGWLSHIV